MKKREFGIDTKNPISNSRFYSVFLFKARSRYSRTTRCDKISVRVEHFGCSGRGKFIVACSECDGLPDGLCSNENTAGVEAEVCKGKRVIVETGFALPNSVSRTEDGGISR